MAMAMLASTPASPPLTLTALPLALVVREALVAAWAALPALASLASWATTPA
jgi:hypothetical protein